MCYASYFNLNKLTVGKGREAADLLLYLSELLEFVLQAAEPSLSLRHSAGLLLLQETLRYFLFLH